MGVRQAIFRRYNSTEGFFIRDLRGDSVNGANCTNGPGCKQLDPREYLRVLQTSKFCLAPSGMGFSTRSYESMAQGCVPLVIQVRVCPPAPPCTHALAHALARAHVGCLSG